MNQSAHSPDAASVRTRFAALAARYEADLLRTARRLSNGNEDRAQDLVQDALINGFIALRDGQFDDSDPARARAYLIRTVTNRFINDYRRRVKWEAGIDVETLTAGGEIGPSQTRAQGEDLPGATLLEQTLDEPLERALAMLSDISRIVITLVDIEERPYEEAASLLGVPIGTIRSRLARARAQLRDLLFAYAKERRLV